MSPMSKWSLEFWHCFKGLESRRVAKYFTRASSWQMRTWAKCVVRNMVCSVHTKKNMLDLYNIYIHRHLIYNYHLYCIIMSKNIVWLLYACTMLYWTTLHWPTCKILSIVGSVVSAFNPLMSCLKSSLLECLSEPATPITILILQSVLQLPKHVSSLVGLFFLAGHFFLIFFKALSTSLLRLAALMFFGNGNAGKTVCVANVKKKYIYIYNII